MLKAERHRLILEVLENQGHLSVADLCQQFGVSEMTIRRDLSDLEQQGLLRRVHGGAVKDLGRSNEPPYHLRATENLLAKRAIGHKAAELVFNGDSIALDTGTSTVEVVANLQGKTNLTIVTHSLIIANEVIGTFQLESDVRLVLTGGIVRGGELSMIGHIPERTYQELHVDKAFIGIGALDLKAGLTEYSLEDALAKRTLLDSAKEIIILADGSKFGRVAFSTICPIDCADIVITDPGAPPDIVSEVRRAGIRVIVADYE